MMVMVMVMVIVIVACLTCFVEFMNKYIGKEIVCQTLGMTKTLDC